MTFDGLLQSWSGDAFRHIPAGSPYDVLDFRFAGRAADDRWNRQSDPTLYLTSDHGVVLAEFARQLKETRAPGASSGATTREIFRLRVAVDHLLDLRNREVCQRLPIQDAPLCFLDKKLSRAVAELLRRATPAQALLVPSVAFLDQPERWVLVLFLEKLPPDPRQFVATVEPVGTFQVGAE